ERLASIFTALHRIAEAGLQVVVPLHPRTRKNLGPGLRQPPGVHLLPPVSYEQMLLLQARARVIVTDSGGVQKEAYWLGVPCVTLRDETEWVETVQAGWNVLAGAETARIVELTQGLNPPAVRPALYGEANAVDAIVERL